MPLGALGGMSVRMVPVPIPWEMAPKFVDSRCTVKLSSDVGVVCCTVWMSIVPVVWPARMVRVPGPPR